MSRGSGLYKISLHCDHGNDIGNKNSSSMVLASRICTRAQARLSKDARATAHVSAKASSRWSCSASRLTISCILKTIMAREDMND